MRVEVALGAHAPVQHHPAIRAVLDHVPQDALQRGESGAAADHQHGHARRRRPVRELPERTLDRQQGAAGIRAEQPFGEFAARNPPHVQLEQARVVRRRGDREAAPAAARQHDVEVLAGLKSKRSAAGSRRNTPSTSCDQPLDALDAARAGA